MPGVSSRHKKGPVRLPWGERWPFSGSKRRPGTAAAWLPFFFVLTPIIIYHTVAERLTCLPLQRAGNDPIHLCISNLADIQKELGQSLSCESLTNKASFESKWKGTLIIHLTLHDGNQADKRLKRWPWTHFCKPAQTLQNWAREDTWEQILRSPRTAAQSVPALNKTT